MLFSKFYGAKKADPLSTLFEKDELTDVLIEALSMLQEHLIHNQRNMNYKRTEIELLRRQNEALKEILMKLEQLVGAKF